MTVPLDRAVIATDRGADRPTSAEDILDLLDALRPAWHADAACRGQTAVMFPVAEHGHRLDTTAARALCDRCPVRNPCAEAGRSERVWDGVWGEYRVRQQTDAAAERSAAIQGGARRWRVALDRRDRRTSTGISPPSPLSRRARLAGVLDVEKRHPPPYYRLKDHMIAASPTSNGFPVLAAAADAGVDRSPRTAPGDRPAKGQAHQSTTVAGRSPPIPSSGSDRPGPLDALRVANARTRTSSALAGMESDERVEAMATAARPATWNRAAERAPPCTPSSRRSSRASRR